MKSTHISLEEHLKTVVEKDPNSIAQFVAKVALETESPKLFFQDLGSHGCISGIIGELVYYHDTHGFFDSFYKEIEQLRSEHEILIPNDKDLKNYLAWASVEIVAYQIYQDWKNGS